ncbi:MAG: hypothetical protein K8F31_01910, partial [Roseovarius sp.]|nr:hypothetical protein [Roseovarius sp.]
MMGKAKAAIRLHLKLTVVGFAALLIAAAWVGRVALATSPPPPTNYTLQMTVSPGTGGSVMPNPNPLFGNAPATPTWTETYTSGANVTLTATPAAGKMFDYWGGNLTGSTNPKSITMTSNKTVTAYFVNSYTLTTAVQGSGSVSPTAGTYKSGTVVPITATPAQGWAFDHWTGSLTGSTNPTSLTMNANKSVTAVFVQGCSLTTAVVGSGSISPSGGLYNYGQVIQLTATPATGWRFDHWSGALSGSTNPSNLTMDGDKSVTATFIQTFTLSTSASGNGSITPSAGTYDTGTVVSLQATPDAGWRFKEWTGALSGSTNPTNLTMNSNKSVGATFVQTFTLATNVAGSGSVSPTGGTYDAQDSVQLT